MSKIIESIEQRQLRPNIPLFKAGDTVRVHFQVIEGQRRRIQVFEGIVIKRQGAGVRETFTVRKQSFGVGVERTFPLHSPKIEKIEVGAIGDVRRAKLYYLREQGRQEGAGADEGGRGASADARRRAGRAQPDRSRTAEPDELEAAHDEAADAEAASEARLRRRVRSRDRVRVAPTTPGRLAGTGCLSSRRCAAVA